MPKNGDLNIDLNLDLNLNLGKRKPKKPRKAEESAKAEVSEILQGMQARQKREQDRADVACDGDFWACFVFESHAQRQEAFRCLGLLDLLDDQYVDGVKFFERLRVLLPPEPLLQSERAVNNRWSKLAEKQRRASCEGE